LDSAITLEVEGAKRVVHYRNFVIDLAANFQKCNGAFVLVIRFGIDVAEGMRSGWSTESDYGRVEDVFVDPVAELRR
jgi:hypothetical protein